MGDGMGAAEEAVVRRMCELWDTHDADAMADLFAEDGVYHNVPNPQPMEGREAVRAYLRNVCERLGVEAEVLHLACDGEWVLSERLDTHVEGDRRMSLPVINIQPRRGRQARTVAGLLRHTNGEGPRPDLGGAGLWPQVARPMIR
jgi:limonene-1,2-epoxide hydrolase